MSKLTDDLAGAVGFAEIFLREPLQPYQRDLVAKLDAIVKRTVENPAATSAGSYGKPYGIFRQLGHGVEFSVLEDPRDWAPNHPPVQFIILDDYGTRPDMDALFTRPAEPRPNRAARRRAQSRRNHDR